MAYELRARYDEAQLFVDVNRCEKDPTATAREIAARFGSAFVAHSMPVVRYLSTRIAVMYRGKIVEIGSTEQITGQPQHPYTRSLLEATPELEV